jgi:hypothetical protein
MKKNRLIGILLVLILVGCDDDEKAIEAVTENIERGAVLRTLSLNNTNFLVGDATGVFSVSLEEQDIQDGDLMERVDIYARFIDNTPENGGSNSVEAKVRTLLPDDFADGPLGLPRTTLEIPITQLMEATSMSMGQMLCKDQFIVRLDIHLKDGRNFTEGDGSSWIIGLGSSFSSPYNYTINIVEPIEDQLFTGTYLIENVVRGPFGVTFVTDQSLTVEVIVGHSPNVRLFETYYAAAHILAEQPKFFEFTVACDEIVFAKNQFTSFEGYCTFSSPPILIGPGIPNGAVNPIDDSVFELNVTEGYLGFDGGCGFGTVVSELKFSKQ